jgi:hypothetical protein
VPERVHLDNLVHSDLLREEGHKGIAAQLFPLQYNQHVRVSRFFDGKEPPMSVTLGLACRMFDLLRALFPKQTWNPDYSTGGFFDLPERPSSVTMPRACANGCEAK